MFNIYYNHLKLYANLVVISDGDVGLDTKWPVNVENIFVESQHEHNQDKQSIEDGKEKH